jgi:uncharacterized NAD-dependent epimerase/dehydratase family protein
MPHSVHRDFRKRTIVHLVEGSCSPRSAKTTRGILCYSPHESVALIDSTNVGRTAQHLLDAGGDIPIDACLADVLRRGLKPDTLVIGVNPVGGRVPPAFRRHIIEALEAGLDVWSGMHQFLADDHEFRVAAERGGAQIWDVRRPPQDLPVGVGAMMTSKSYCALMVGTDCALGKMTAALELQRTANARGLRAEFIATGQTGMMIAGWGHPIDAIPGDFMAGCVEKDCLSVDGQCDLILVEGQGSLIHPGYSPVTLGLMHGAMPDAMILCHLANKSTIGTCEHVRIPSLRAMADLYEAVQQHLKPSPVVAGALNTHGLSDAAARAALDAAAADLGLPVTDPVRYGPQPLLEALEAHRRSIGK